MDGQPPADDRLTARVRRWLANLRFRQMWQLTVALILAATAAFGGLDAVDTKVAPFKARRAGEVGAAVSRCGGDAAE
jgi:hypothetical protein